MIYLLNLNARITFITHCCGSSLKVLCCFGGGSSFESYLFLWCWNTTSRAKTSCISLKLLVSCGANVVYLRKGRVMMSLHWIIYGYFSYKSNHMRTTWLSFRFKILHVDTCHCVAILVLHFCKLGTSRKVRLWLIVDWWACIWKKTNKT